MLNQEWNITKKLLELEIHYDEIIMLKLEGVNQFPKCSANATWRQPGVNTHLSKF